MVLIAGKDHEEYRVLPASKQPFSDFAVAEAALSRWSRQHG